MLYKSGHAKRPQDHQKIKLDCNSTHSLIPCSVCKFKAEVSEDNWVLGSFIWLLDHFYLNAKAKQSRLIIGKVLKTKISSDIWAIRHTQI